MTLQLLRRALVLGIALAALPAAAQNTTTFTVNSPLDDVNSRDANPGDGECVDMFTESNPDAQPRCTLRAAIDEANATSGDVVINLPGQLAGGASGNYTLTRTAPNMMDNTFEDANAFGDLDLGGQFSSLTIRGTGTPGPTVKASPNDRVFHLLSGTVIIERVTITGGTAQPGDNGVSSPGEGESVDGGDGADGGCVLIASAASAGFDQVSVNNCATSSGGNGAAPASSIERTAGGNAGAGGNGGGIANYGSLALRRSFVFQNGTGDGGSPGAGTPVSGGTAVGGNGGNGGLGGGVYNAGLLVVEETTIVNNTAGDPSAGAAGTNGGAAGIDGEGGSGGGIASLMGGSTFLRNTIVASNTAGDDVNNDGTDILATKQPGSDLYDGDPVDDDEVGAFFTPFETGSFTEEAFNLIGTNNSVENVFPAGMPNGANNIVGTGQGDQDTRIDPGVTGANQNENFAVTAVALASDSPAIDAGGNTDRAGNEIVADGRGFRRPGTAEGDETVDIGGYEFNSEPIMSQLVINELDSVTAPATEEDAAEFIEIKNTGTFPAQLADYALVLYSGADNTAYAAYNLEGTLAPGETFVFGDTGVQMVDQAGLSGAPDDIRDEDGAVGLYLGNASDYPVGALAGQNASTRVDVLVYNNGTQASRLRDAGDLGDAFGVPDDEIASGDTDDGSIQRGEGGGYSSGPPTPGGDSAVGTDTDDGVPGVAEISAVFPNPATSGAAIEVSVAVAQAVTVEVFDALGRRVARVQNDAVTAGQTLSVDLPTARLAPGVYVVRVAGETFQESRQLTVVR